MENQTLGTYIQVPINEKSVTTDLSGDFTLPDYHPEIKRLLKVSASVLPPAKYIGDSEGEFSGNIDYFVTYTGSDNQIYCAPLTTEYKITVPMEKNELTLVNMSADAEITPENVGGRVTSPRKLNIKCRLKTRARMYGDMPIDSSYASMSEDNQVLFGKERISRRTFTQSEVIHLSDEIIQGRDEEVRVISAEGHVLVSEVSCANGAVNVKGEVYLKLIMCREPDGVPYTALRRLPLSETVMLDGADNSCEANARGSVCEMNINVEDDRVVIDLGVILEMSVCKNEDVVYVKDLYSTTNKTDCTYREIPTLREGRAFNSNFTQSDSMTLEEAGLTPEHKIVDITGYAYPESAVLDGERWVFSGKTRFSVLAEKDGEYSNAELELPYRYSIDSKNIEGENFYASAVAEVISARARLDGERIGVDAEVMMCGVISKTENTRMLDSVSFGEESESRGGEYIIYYPSKTDSLWSVAKRYGKTVRALTLANKLTVMETPDSVDTLDGVHFLVV